MGYIKMINDLDARIAASKVGRLCKACHSVGFGWQHALSANEACLLLATLQVVCLNLAQSAVMASLRTAVLAATQSRPLTEAGPALDSLLLPWHIIEVIEACGGRAELPAAEQGRDHAAPGGLWHGSRDHQPQRHPGPVRCPAPSGSQGSHFT